MSLKILLPMYQPKRLTTTAEFSQVEKMLFNFYRLRPAEYHIDQVEEHDLEQYVQFIVEFAKPPAQILEFGAGSWRLPVTLHRHGYNVVGCDIFSDADLARFSQQLPSNDVSLKSYDGHTLPFDDKTFDIVSSRNVFEHLLNVEQALQELDRVLKPNGTFIISCPNWSGPNNAVRALQQIMIKQKMRYWQYDSYFSAFFGIFRTLKWYLEVRFSRQPNFIFVHPRSSENKINFEFSDDDVVHLCQPLSLYKWFQKHGYETIVYNNFRTESTISSIFNPLFPSFATTNRLAFRKASKNRSNG